MKQLNAALLASGFNSPDGGESEGSSSGLQIGPVEQYPERVLQFGEGNFLRAFVDWMINAMNAQGLFCGRVVVVQPIPQGLVSVLNEQDGLYTVLLHGLQKGERVESRNLVTSVSRGIDPYNHWADFLSCAGNPDLRFIVSNTTEAGIAYVDEPMPTRQCPASYPAKLAALLHERYRRFDGAPDKGFIIIPCELIDRNGDNLKKCVLQHCDAWKLGDDFRNWLEQSNTFFNTLVDRIVTGYPKAEHEKITAELGYEDRLLDTGEIFHLWVIEGGKRYRSELPFEEAGLNVLWTDDMTPYRTRKVRILNGAHTTMVPAAHLAGKKITRECVEDPVIGAYLKRAVFEEIVPTIDLPADECTAFAEDVLERFSNPFINHALLDIAPNSISKYPVRVLPSLLEYHKRTGKLPRVLSFSLAALIAFYRGTEIENGVLKGSVNGIEYPIKDDLANLEFFADCWKNYAGEQDTAGLVNRALAKSEYWEQDLNDVPGLAEIVTADLSAILSKGAGAAIAEMMGAS